MAHYVFQRNNGFGDFDYIASFETMELTDYKEYAAQVDDAYIEYIDIPYLNSLGFFAVRISTLALRINELLNFRPPVRGFRPPAPHPRRGAQTHARTPRAPETRAQTRRPSRGAQTRARSQACSRAQPSGTEARPQTHGAQARPRSQGTPRRRSQEARRTRRIRILISLRLPGGSRFL